MNSVRLWVGVFLGCLSLSLWGCVRADECVGAQCEATSPAQGGNAGVMGGAPGGDSIPDEGVMEVVPDEGMMMLEPDEGIGEPPPPDPPDPPQEETIECFGEDVLPEDLGAHFVQRVEVCMIEQPMLCPNQHWHPMVIEQANDIAFNRLEFVEQHCSKVRCRPLFEELFTEIDLNGCQPFCSQGFGIPPLDFGEEYFQPLPPDLNPWIVDLPECGRAAPEGIFVELSVSEPGLYHFELTDPTGLSIGGAMMSLQDGPCGIPFVELAACGAVISTDLPTGNYSLVIGSTGDPALFQVPLVLRVAREG